MLNLKTALPFGVLAQKIEQDFRRDLGVQEVAEPLAEMLIGRLVDTSLRIHRMDPPRAVRHHGDLFVFKGAPGLGAQFSTVEPHVFGH